MWYDYHLRQAKIGTNRLYHRKKYQLHKQHLQIERLFSGKIHFDRRFIGYSKYEWDALITFLRVAVPLLFLFCVYILIFIFR